MPLLMLSFVWVNLLAEVSESWDTLSTKDEFYIILAYIILLLSLGIGLKQE